MPSPSNAIVLLHTLSLFQPTAEVHGAWTTNDYIALASAIAAVASAFAAFLSFWPYLRQRIIEKRISKDFGAELYLPEVVRAATRFYVRPEASSLDLAQELEEPSNRVPTREDLFKAVERFLDDDSEHRHLFLLADSGMGKSAFVLNFYAHNGRRFALKRYRLAVIPLGYARAIERIQEIENKRNTVIFLDAFDEDPLAREDYFARLKLLLEACTEFKRVLITCRTQFFPKDDAIPVSTGLIKLGPRNSEAHYQFWRLYIAPLSDEQVDEYLRSRYRIWEYPKRKKGRSLVKKIPLLSLRPMLLTHIPEIMAANVTVTYSWQLYQLMIEAWYEREKGWWQETKSIQSFSEEVAINLYLNYLNQKADRIPRSELAEIIRTISAPIDEWNATSRSLLHRDAEGNFKFAHRSIMEFLVIKRFIAGDKRCLDISWTDQMRQFMVEILRTPRTLDSGTVSIWDRFELNGADLRGADLQGVELRGKNLSRARFNGSNLRFANCQRVTIRGTDFSGADLSHCNLSEAKDDTPLLNKDLYLSGKQIFIAGRGEQAPKPQDFGEKDEIQRWWSTFAEPPNFENASLREADLTNTILCGAVFDNADLSRANLKKANLRFAKARKAQMTEADLRGARLMNANFAGADFTGALLNSASIRIVITSLRGANFSGAVGLSPVEVAGCEIDQTTKLPPDVDEFLRSLSPGNLTD